MSTGESLRSKRYDLADAFAANELYQAKGWTDGLPIVPPTEERVSECLDAAGLAPGNNLESAVAATLPPGLYTALLAGLNNGTGIGLVEIYDLGP